MLVCKFNSEQKAEFTHILPNSQQLAIFACCGIRKKTDAPIKAKLFVCIRGMHGNFVIGSHSHFRTCLKVVFGIQKHKNTKMCAYPMHSLASKCMSKSVSNFSVSIYSASGYLLRFQHRNFGERLQFHFQGKTPSWKVQVLFFFRFLPFFKSKILKFLKSTLGKNEPKNVLKVGTNSIL